MDMCGTCLFVLYREFVLSSEVKCTSIIEKIPLLCPLKEVLLIHFCFLYVGPPCNLRGLQASMIIFILLCLVLAVALVIALIVIWRLRRGFVYIKSRGRRISLGGPSETYNRLEYDGKTSIFPSFKNTAMLCMVLI